MKKITTNEKNILGKKTRQIENKVTWYFVICALFGAIVSAFKIAKLLQAQKYETIDNRYLMSNIIESLF